MCFLISRSIVLYLKLYFVYYNLNILSMSMCMSVSFVLCPMSMVCLVFYVLQRNTLFVYYSLCLRVYSNVCLLRVLKCIRIKCIYIYIYYMSCIVFHGLHCMSVIRHILSWMWSCVALATMLTAASSGINKHLIKLLLGRQVRFVSVTGEAAGRVNDTIDDDTTPAPLVPPPPPLKWN